MSKIRFTLVLFLVSLSLAGFSKETKKNTPKKVEIAGPYDAWFKFDLAKTGEGVWEAVILDNEDGLKKLRIKSGAKVKEKSKDKVLFLIDGQTGWSDTSMQKILNVFADKGVYPEIVILNTEKNNENLKKAFQYAENKNFNLIYTFGSSILKDALKEYKGKKLPVVSACNKDPVLLGYIKDYENGSGTNFAFTSVNTPIEVQVALLKKLKKEMKNVAILVDKSNASAMKTQYKPLKEMLLKEKINVVDIIVGPEDEKDPQILEKVKADLKVAIPNAGIEMKKTDPELKNSIIWLTYCTSIIKNMQTLIEVSKNIPVVGVATDTVMAGDISAVIGIGVSFESNAFTAAVYGINILNGRVKPGDLKVGLAFPPDIAVNFKVASMISMKIPFAFFESATVIYDKNGIKVRGDGVVLDLEKTRVTEEKK